MKMIKNVRFFERRRLKKAGRFDGKRGLPRNDGDGRWISPFLDQEVRTFQQSVDQWKALLADKLPLYAQLGNQLDGIDLTLSRLAEARDRLHQADSQPYPTGCKPGEEGLSEMQLLARRKAERKRQLAPLSGRIAALQDQLTQQLDACSQLYGQLLEEHHKVRLHCEAMKRYILRRVDFYWDAALRRNPELPTLPAVKVSSGAEALYMEAHKELFLRAELLISSQKKENAA